ncbi:MAG TPA: hypothetical protein VF515_19545 [Candidatus Binatia bacterium]
MGWRKACLVVVLLAGLTVLGACTARQPRPTAAEKRAAIERSAPLPEEAGVGDQIGQVGVAVLLVVVTVGGILLPILLL